MLSRSNGVNIEIIVHFIYLFVHLFIYSQGGALYCRIRMKGLLQFRHKEQGQQGQNNIELLEGLHNL